MAEKKKDKTEKKATDVFDLKASDKYETVEDLMERSQPNVVYYSLLLLSSLIIAAGLLLDNPAIVIGGMLVTPVLTPVLLISLGITIGDISYTKRMLMFVAKSLLVVVLSGFVLGIIFGVNGENTTFVFENSMRGAALYFVVAIASGLAATFAWMRKEVNEILPGIAVAVSLVPPLGLIGIGFSTLTFEIIRFNFFVFFFNLLGVIVGSILVFSLLKFHRIEKRVEKEVKKQEKEMEKKKKEKEREKKE